MRNEAGKHQPVDGPTIAAVAEYLEVAAGQLARLEQRLA
jgi:hypothetical protein